MANDRDHAERSETVQLYAYYYMDGVLADVYDPGTVYIRSGLSYSAHVGPLTPTHGGTGTYYIEWDIPSDEPVGYHYDVWSGLQYLEASDPTTATYAFAVLYNGLEIPIPDTAETDIDRCHVYGFLLTPDGVALEDVRARASIVNMPYTDGDNVLVNTGTAVEVLSDANGRVDWYLPQGATVHIDIRDANYSELKVVPEEDSADLGDLEDA